MHSFDGPSDDWSEAETAAYAARIEQFVAMPGGATNEAMADGLGAFVAYEAFERVARGRPATRIDGLTPDQRYFVMVANGITYMIVAHGLENATEVARGRINAAVSGVPAFAQAVRLQAWRRHGAAAEPAVRPALALAAQILAISSILQHRSQANARLR